MTTAASGHSRIGTSPIGNFATPDSVQAHPLGTKLPFMDPFYGGGEAIYLQMPTSTAIQVGTLLAYDTATSYVASLVPNTANLGKSVGVLMNYVPSSASVVYAWVQISGQALFLATASVAADTAFGITASGKVGANSAGKEVLNARVTKPATTTVAKTNTVTTSGSNVIKVTNSDGWFVGVPIAGTGIPASSYVGGIDPSGTLVSVTTSDLVTAANATASGSVTVTATLNDATLFWLLCTGQSFFVQGAIT